MNLPLQNSSAQKWLFWVSNCLWGVMIMVMLFIGKSVVANDVRATERHMMIIDRIGALDGRVKAIEGNRFTATDAHHLMQTIVNKLPPKWLVDKVEDNHKEIKTINSKLNMGN